jgi:hypothetical protein
MWRYYYWEWRDSVGDYSKTIDIKFLKKYWYLDVWIKYRKWWLQWNKNWKDSWNIGVEVTKWETTWKVRVIFSQTNNQWEVKQFDYTIPLVSTPCNYWGVRWWLLCPCKWNRCSILYKQNNWIFASRKTLNLCYSEQKESKRYRYMWFVMWDAFTKIEVIRRTMKYPMRNGKFTKKALRIIKLKQKMPTMEDVGNMHKVLRW